MSLDFGGGEILRIYAGLSKDDALAIVSRRLMRRSTRRKEETYEQHK